MSVLNKETTAESSIVIDWIAGKTLGPAFYVDLR